MSSTLKPSEATRTNVIRYLSQSDIRSLAPSWKSLIVLIDDAIKAIVDNDYVQPIKPYLRYRNPINRIIAMPAYLGGSFDVAGIKWIASFPENIKNNNPRASSISILNNSQTGAPQAILSTNELSGLRTAAVSGYVLKKMRDFLPDTKLKIGIVGYGPIGQLHAKMILEVLDGQIKQLCIYDSGHIEKKDESPHLKFTNSWKEAYEDSDVFFCCTTSPKRYIDLMPKAGSLHLNVSLRDYLPEIVMKSSILIVDDWEEVCREDTDIHRCALEYALKKEQCISLPDLSKTNLPKLIKECCLIPLHQGYISFHPMGMAVFDMAISQFIYQQSLKNNVGTILSQ